MFYSNLFQYFKQLMTLIVAIDVEQMKSFSSKIKEKSYQMRVRNGRREAMFIHRMKKTKVV